MTDADLLPEALGDTRPSARAVYLVLVVDGPATVGELAATLLFSRGTIRNALDDLDAAGVLETRRAADARQRRYAVDTSKDST